LISDFCPRKIAVGILAFSKTLSPAIRILTLDIFFKRNSLNALNFGPLMYKELVIKGCTLESPWTGFPDGFEDWWVL